MAEDNLRVDQEIDEVFWGAEELEEALYDLISHERYRHVSSTSIIGVLEVVKSGCVLGLLEEEG